MHTKLPVRRKWTPYVVSVNMCHTQKATLAKRTRAILCR